MSNSNDLNKYKLEPKIDIIFEFMIKNLFQYLILGFLLVITSSMLALMFRIDQQEVKAHIFDIEWYFICAIILVVVIYLLFFSFFIVLSIRLYDKMLGRSVRFTQCFSAFIILASLNTLGAFKAIDIIKQILSVL
ncbi:MULTISPECIES: hypothetical protein [unclassified Clostridioides]|uniref:hypothetical protein n=1 Tax=unclassified Clostridioides TaxID=2635829 RepID=UPI001D1032AD|nr:hypothetical protein [Clostridioides sp. ES-S-0171-01]MCC0689178.1 hypothetical protein [Clostridioides sp. ES-S-0056-01]MCC0716852.1 hypothetical protein [Clostridioides sp. ES-S-0077-01]